MTINTTTGGGALLAKKGKKYFSKLAKQGWIKRKAKLELWKKQQEKMKKKMKTTSR